MKLFKSTFFILIAFHVTNNFGISQEEWAKAICEGDTNKVKELLDSGEFTANSPFFDPNASVALTETYPIVYAVDCNQKGVVSLLLSRKGDPNLRLYNGNRSPLAIAILNNNIDIAKLLIAHGASVNDLAFLGTTLFNYTVHQLSPNMLDLLVENGLDTNLPDAESITPLISAINANRPDIVEQLIKVGANPNYSPEWRILPLNQAIKNKNVAIAKSLIDGGASVEVALADTTFAAIIRSLTVPMLDLLVENGLNISLPDENGTTLLSTAINADRTDIIEYLIEAGAKPESEKTISYKK